MGSGTSSEAGASSRGASSSRKKEFRMIPDRYRTVEEVTAALQEAGLESCNLIVGVDFTKSNTWTGKRSFGGQSLHTVSSSRQNPYERSLSVMARTLSALDDDSLIPAYGFGCSKTGDKNVFSFVDRDRPCYTIDGVLRRYRELAPRVRLPGPTSFGPIIRKAIEIVSNTGQYHILLIVADGQVTRSSSVPANDLSPQEQDTVDAIVEASHYPLSIVMVGVGDGPWDMMEEFDDRLPQRAFDNWQFVNLESTMPSHMEATPAMEAKFATQALMEVPEQYQYCLSLPPPRPTRAPPAREPPVACMDASIYDPDVAEAAGVVPGPDLTSLSSYGSLTAPGHGGSSASAGAGAGSGDALAEAARLREEQTCPVCLDAKKDMVFQCGHQTCSDCGNVLNECPICRAAVVTRIRLY